MIAWDKIKKIRTYLDYVPESVKEQLSKVWGERKRETFDDSRWNQF